ncbi:hypothetical protein TNCV_3640421 [Trichonephila clavipes]|nr:hypothetical protein TNCV_3640421 [Trichonephila clavipes]
MYVCHKCCPSPHSKDAEKAATTLAEKIDCRRRSIPVPERIPFIPKSTSHYPHHSIDSDIDSDGEPLARVPLMARSAIFWARHRSKQSTVIDSSIKEFSVRFSQFKELSETFKFIMYPDETFDKLNLPQSDLGN